MQPAVVFWLKLGHSLGQDFLLCVVWAQSHGPRPARTLSPFPSGFPPLSNTLCLPFQSFICCDVLWASFYSGSGWFSLLLSLHLAPSLMLSKSSSTQPGVSSSSWLRQRSLGLCGACRPGRLILSPLSGSVCEASQGRVRQHGAWPAVSRLFSMALKVLVVLILFLLQHFLIKSRFYLLFSQEGYQFHVCLFVCFHM